MADGAKAVVFEWQVSHCEVVGMCPEFLPVAVAPLWQVEHLPAIVASCGKLAGLHSRVVWQLSQDAVVATWFAGLPVARLPLWQVAQVPAMTPTWL